MPFGSFNAQERTVKKKEKPMKEPMAPKPLVKESPAVNSTKLNILLIGRNMALIQEFLCSMNQNMSQALHAQGMTYYTRELNSISDIVSQKKKLEQFFWSFSTTDWTYPVDNTDGKTYTFSISPSGDQRKALDLVIHCVVPEQESEVKLEHMDACWILADGMLLDSGVGYDSYEQYIANKLDRFAQYQDSYRPICLILSQIEKWGHFDGISGTTVFPKAVYRQLTDICRAKFTALGNTERPIAVILIQIYGGLEYIGVDQNNQPMLHIGQSGFYQSYIPDSCETPGLYTIQALCANRSIDFLSGTPEGGLLHVIRNHFADKYGNAGWHPAFLGGKEEA